LYLQDKDAEKLDRIAGSIQGRTNRIGDVVASEMDNYEPGVYTERVLSAVRLLRGQILPSFSSKVNEAMNSIDPANGNGAPAVDENEFIDASRMVYDGVRDVRRAVLLNRGEGDYESDTDIEVASEVSSSIPESQKHEITLVDEYPEITGITNAREAMKILPEEDKIKIAEQVSEFKIERQKFDREVSKWDDNGNDVIVIAKHMCTIMMEMTDFTRGKGHLKTTMDVIEAAQKISEAGTNLDKLARAIADECPESSTKKDLLAYLQRIALYCHQLNITSKVKADVQNVSGELIVSGLDSATSLIQAAKNLMNAVVLTVKASYVASTKYRSKVVDKEAAPLVVWKMKAPEKKPLVRAEAPEESRLKVRRGSTKKKQNHMEILSDFDKI
jgi:catenin alpha